MTNNMGNGVVDITKLVKVVSGNNYETCYKVLDNQLIPIYDEDNGDFCYQIRFKCVFDEPTLLYTREGSTICSKDDILLYIGEKQFVLNKNTYDTFLSVLKETIVNKTNNETI